MRLEELDNNFQGDFTEFFVSCNSLLRSIQRANDASLSFKREKGDSDIFTTIDA